MNKNPLEWEMSLSPMEGGNFYGYVSPAMNYPCSDRSMGVFVLEFI